MLNLRPHHRIKIPDLLAVFAVILLLVSSVAGIGTSQNTIASDQETMISANAESPVSDDTDNTNIKRSRGLNLGLLLFRR